VLEPRMEPLNEHELRALPKAEQARYRALLEALNREPTEIVFIGQGLSRHQDEIVRRLETCLA
jgi:hypothetical protein